MSLRQKLAILSIVGAIAMSVVTQLPDTVRRPIWSLYRLSMPVLAVALIAWTLWTVLVWLRRAGGDDE